MQRVMIVGGPGSGKSTLARMLGEITNLPVYHMDHIHWKSGWVERAADEKHPLIAEIQARDQWIFEGNHSRSYNERIVRADTFIWLDMGFALRFWRIIRRTLFGLGRNRPDLPDGCPEHIGRESLMFWRWAWDTRHSHRDKLLAIMDAPPAHVTVHHLTSLRAVQAYLCSLEHERTQ